MSERLIIGLTRLAAAGIGAAAICYYGATMLTDEYDSKPQIPRCPGKPLPNFDSLVKPPSRPHRPESGNDIETDSDRKLYRQKRNQYYRDSERYMNGLTFPHLTVRVGDKLTKGDPIETTHLDTETDDAIVQLSTTTIKGSGFLTTGPDGSQLAVTAAHVVSTAKLSKLKITNDKGEETRAVGGCYIFDNAGRHEELNNEDTLGVDYDLAVLKLQRPLGNRTIRLADNAVKRGSWVLFHNYQDAHEPGDPAFYSGMVAAPYKSRYGLNVISPASPLDTQRNKDELEDKTLLPGASGGVVLNTAGEAVGISTAGTDYTKFLGPDALKGGYDIRFKGAHYGDDGGFIPGIVFITPNNAIRQAIKNLPSIK